MREKILPVQKEEEQAGRRQPVENSGNTDLQRTSREPLDTKKAPNWGFSERDLFTQLVTTYSSW